MGLTRGNIEELKGIVKETVVAVLDCYLDTITEKIMLKIKDRMEEEFKRLNFRLQNDEFPSTDRNLEELKSRLHKTESNLEHLQQESRRNNVIVFGIPESDNSDLKKKLIAMCQDKMVNIDARFIKSCYRLGKGVKNKTRPIIVKFLDESYRSEFYSSRKLFVGSKVFVKEDLTRKRIDIFKYAIAKFPKNVWTVDGIIKVRTEKGVISVNDKQDVDSLV